MLRHLFLMMCLLTAGYLLSGQSGGSAPVSGDLLLELQGGPGSDQVVLELDSMLVANYYKLITSNRQITGVPGYRIRIYSESGLGAKEEQQLVKVKFLSLYPGIDAYSRYDEPFFKLYVGDCRTRSEALKLFDLVKRNFPNPIIVEDNININHND